MLHRTLLLTMMMTLLFSSVITFGDIDPWDTSNIDSELRSGKYLDARDIDRLGDNRARSYNDLFTITIEQNSDAKMEKTIKTDNTSSFDAKVGAWARPKGSLTDLTFDQNKKTGPTLSLESSKKLDTKGERTEKSRFNDKIQAKIVEVLPNGTVRFEASKQLTVGADTEVVIFSGVIRLADIDTTNNVSSSKVAEACVVYVGKGMLQKATQRGALGRMLDYFWLF